MRLHHVCTLAAVAASLCGCPPTKPQQAGGAPGAVTTSAVTTSAVTSGDPTPLPKGTFDEPPSLFRIARSGGGLEEIDLSNAADLERRQGRGVTPAPGFARFEVQVDGDTIRVYAAPKNYSIQKDVPGKPNQHIHVILDNQPYVAHYDPDTPTVFQHVAPGAHVVTAFLARAYHLSLKNPEASAVALVTVGDDPQAGPPVPDIEGPMLIYSRPKGSYSKAAGETKAILCDFYLRNVKLGEPGYSVRASLDGGKQVLLFTAWEPQLFTVDPAVGEHKVTLELLDADGKRVDIPWNPTTRTFKVTD